MGDKMKVVIAATKSLREKGIRTPHLPSKIEPKQGFKKVYKRNKRHKKLDLQ
jgi:hypothetical protein